MTSLPRIAVTAGVWTPLQPAEDRTGCVSAWTEGDALVVVAPKEHGRVLYRGVWSVLAQTRDGWALVLRDGRVVSLALECAPCARKGAGG